MAKNKLSDPVDLLVQLIQCPSITPEEGGALDFLEKWLSERGFQTHRLPYGEGSDAPSDNLYARYGRGEPHFCFAGHTDVVPPGDAATWQEPPFSGAVKDGFVWGRGAVDMKGGIACFMAAVDRVLADGAIQQASVSLLITGDEEGPAIHGTKAVVEWMRENDEVPSLCVVGEPTNPNALTDAVKIGRRGSMTGYFTVSGVQGHSAYPHLAKNPVHAIAELCHSLSSHELDKGSAHFPPSNLEVVSIDVGNPANNVIPAQASAIANLRFNDHHSSEALKSWIDGLCGEVADKHNLDVSVTYQVSGESFVFEPGDLGERIASAVEDELGTRPEYSTSGGTSDARFIKEICPVAEYGLVGQTMHKVDERASVSDMRTLTNIYERLLRDVLTS